MSEAEQTPKQGVAKPPRRKREKPEPLKLHTPVPEWSAKPCPFCGWVPSIQGWHGAPVLLSCDYERCHAHPRVTGDTRRQVLARWNRRAS